MKDVIINDITSRIEVGKNVELIAKEINNSTGTFMRKKLKKVLDALDNSKMNKVTFDKLKRLSPLIEDAVTTVGSVSGGEGGSFEPHGQAFGLPYIECDGDSFHSCYKGGKNKNKQWMKKLGTGESANLIRRYANKNPGKQFLLKLKGQQHYVNARNF